MISERKSIRLKGYDYSLDNLYYVTTVVQDRICWFGEIVEPGRDPAPQGFDQARHKISGIQQMSAPGQKKGLPKMVLNEYGQIAKDQWNWLAAQYRYVVLHMFVVMPNHIHGIIEIDRSRIASSDPVKIKPLSELMGAYKTTVSKQIHLAGGNRFQWQRSFYEHIIRDEKSFDAITEYIYDNPVNWENDEFYS